MLPSTPCGGHTPASVGQIAFHPVALLKCLPRARCGVVGCCGLVRLHSAVQTSAVALSYHGVGVAGRRCWRLGWGLGTWELALAEGVSFSGFRLVKPLLVTQPGSAHLRQPGRAVGEDHGLHIRLLSQCGHRLLRHGRSSSRRPSSPASGQILSQPLADASRGVWSPTDLTRTTHIWVPLSHSRPTTLCSVI